MSPALEATRLRAGYGAAEIVHGVDLTLSAGEMLTLIGPNGAGKSTLLKALAGAAQVMGGRVALMGRDVTGADAAGIAAAGAAYVPQERNIFRSLTVEENLGIGGWLAGRQLPARRAQVLRLLPELAGFSRRIAGRLSGGERQTLAGGMALMVEPRVLLVDEPTAGLSPALVGRLLELLRRLADEGLGVLIVEQNARAALARADRAMVLVDGQVAASGTAAEIEAAPDLGALFLGRAA